MNKISFLLLLYLFSNPAFSQETGCIDGNCINGRGTFIFEDGQKYIGDFKNGVSHGQGTHIFEDGEKYEGDFKYDKFNGQGKATYLDSGGLYVGEWKNNKRHGKGKYNFTGGKNAGDFYEGDWKNDEFHGEGIYTFADGEKHIGSFINGFFIPDSCGNIGLKKGSIEFKKCISVLTEIATFERLNNKRD